MTVTQAMQSLTDRGFTIAGTPAVWREDLAQYEGAALAAAVDRVKREYTFERVKPVDVSIRIAGASDERKGAARVLAEAEWARMEIALRYYADFEPGHSKCHTNADGEFVSYTVPDDDGLRQMIGDIAFVVYGGASRFWRYAAAMTDEAWPFERNRFIQTYVGLCLAQAATVPQIAALTEGSRAQRALIADRIRRNLLPVEISKQLASPIDGMRSIADIRRKAL